MPPRHPSRTTAAMAEPAQKNGIPQKKLFITDFDGTLTRTQGGFAARDLCALERLGELGIIRAIATGRSLHSFMKAGGSALPVDYLISSTGAGLSLHPCGRLIRQMGLTGEEVIACVRVLQEEDLDFMIQRPLPDNHLFAYRSSGRQNPDFFRRISLNNGHCRSLGCPSAFGPASQLLAVVPPRESVRALKRIRERVEGLSVIQATSPLDGRSTWIEIFARGVSKSQTASWLAQKLGIDRKNTLSVGNDYNDTDLLEWSAMGFVVENAPDDLKRKFPVVSSNDEGGVAEAIGKWLC